MGDNSPLIRHPFAWSTPRDVAGSQQRQAARRWKSSYQPRTAWQWRPLAASAAQGPATIALAEQCGIVQATPQAAPAAAVVVVDGGKIDARHLPEIGIANAHAGAGVIGGFVVDAERPVPKMAPHTVALPCHPGRGVHLLHARPQLQRPVSGITSGLRQHPHICEYAGGYDVAGDRPTFWPSSTTAPLAWAHWQRPRSSLDVRSGGTYHRAYYAIGAVNMAVAVAPLLLPHSGATMPVATLTRTSSLAWISSHLAAASPRCWQQMVVATVVASGNGDAKSEGTTPVSPP